MSSLSSVNITILGSASAQPSSTRNHSSLALRLDGDVWLFDCGEATQHRIQKSSVKIGKVQKVFITHTHGQWSEHRGTRVQLRERLPYIRQATISSGFCRSWLCG